MIIVCIFVALFLIMTIVTIIVLRKSRKLVNEGEVVKGKISELKKYDSYTVSSFDNASTEVRKTVIEYYVNDKCYHFVPSSYKRNEKEGDEVLVLYNKQDPSIAHRYSSLKYGYIITGIIAAFFLVISVVSLIILSALS